MMREIVIEKASENNLKNVSLRFPHYQLIAVTGVSGSGKTSLVNDIICAEGKRLFYENFVGARYVSAKLTRPRAAVIEGLFPVLSIDQNYSGRSPHSTVGTISELYDLLRLLFARLGKSAIADLTLNRSLFSFNLQDGYCPICKGLGVQDHIDASLLIDDPGKTIREGAFVLTTPNNYIVYSQVTMDVLNQVCQAEGFSVDIPWVELSSEQQNVVLYGSTKIKVLFGKHPLESRLKWQGITAKPRAEDYYKGIIPVMEEILHRERNPNIMRFTRSVTCPVCHGKRLNERALSVKLWGRDISEFTAMSIKEFHHFFHELKTEKQESCITEPIRESILKRTNILLQLGAGHLSLNRESHSLSRGEIQRLRLANQAISGLRNVLYILDEPSAGLHPSEHRGLLEVMRLLVSSGNTVILVDHDEQSIREADWIIDIGPAAGKAGGEILYNGAAADFFSQQQTKSITRKYLTGKKIVVPDPGMPSPIKWFTVAMANKNNLKNISPRFLVNALNVITGVSGSGKTSLVNFMLENTLRQKMGGTEIFRKIIHIDSSPIGRTPTSNPATYTGLSDHVRDLLAFQEDSRKKGYKKGQFSFVVKGGRCETCGGAGVQQIGMHFLGNVQVVCDVCDGRRFNEDTLEIKYKGLNIFDILELTVDEACSFFQDQKKISTIAGILSELGLGYLKLGQPSTTLSSGEAQRIKLAAELSRSTAGHTLYILDEPTTGLHMADVEILLNALKKLIDKGHTLLCIEHDPAFILKADWMVDLGPGSAADGGSIVMEGSIKDVVNHQQSVTAQELRKYISREASPARIRQQPCNNDIIEAPISISGVETNNLKNIDIAFPIDKISAVTGVSGSGKSSLVFGTLYAESQRQFLEGMSSYVQQFTKKAGIPIFKQIHGLVPAIALQKKNTVKNPRSTIATYTGLYDLYRLLFSRLAKSTSEAHRPLSTAFSFNAEEGACPRCRGLGSITVCDAEKLITHPEKPLIAGAMDGSKTGRFYGDPHGQYVATLLAAGHKLGIDFAVPYKALSSQAREVAMHGCGDTTFEVDWYYKRGGHEGVHKLKTSWPGFLNHVETEYFRKHADARGEAMLFLMKTVECSNCKGYRLKPAMLQYTINGLHIGHITAMSTDEALKWFSEDFADLFATSLEKEAAAIFRINIMERLDALVKSGLGYIAADRIVGTLSGGEFQRLQLAGLVRAPLTGVTYILDEPSFGLHQKDLLPVSEIILKLNANGNTIIMVDHSSLLLEKSDFLIKLGPAAGNMGGQVVFSGTSKELPAEKTFYQVKKESQPLPAPGLQIIRAYANNLRDINIDIPKGILSVISGVSGSGKTSLLDKVIYGSYLKKNPAFCERIRGFENFNNLIYIEQPTPEARHNATTGEKLGLSEIIAGIYSNTESSRKQQFKSAHFVKGSRESRCPNCEGSGINTVILDYFSDVVGPCERCGGSGFNDEVMQIMVDGKNIFEANEILFCEINNFLEKHLQDKHKNKAFTLVQLLKKTGLGHLSGGRLLKTLSTGELQRIKLVTGLLAASSNNNLILLDEPTGGLHPADTEQVLKLFEELLIAGNTLVCVSHEPLLLQAASVVIELGPGGGKQGGMVVGCSTK